VFFGWGSVGWGSGLPGGGDLGFDLIIVESVQAGLSGPLLPGPQIGPGQGTPDLAFLLGQMIRIDGNQQVQGALSTGENHGIVGVRHRLDATLLEITEWERLHAADCRQNVDKSKGGPTRTGGAAACRQKHARSDVSQRLTLVDPPPRRPRWGSTEVDHE
jgi:hypothetical protein